VLAATDSKDVGKKGGGEVGRASSVGGEKGEAKKPTLPSPKTGRGKKKRKMPAVADRRKGEGKGKGLFAPTFLGRGGRREKEKQWSGSNMMWSAQGAEEKGKSSLAVDLLQAAGKGKEGGPEGENTTGSADVEGKPGHRRDPHGTP